MAPILLNWLTTSESGVGCLAIEVEHSCQCLISASLQIACELNLQNGVCCKNLFRKCFQN